MSPLPVTLCISTRNAANHLAACIDSCRDWVSEIVIVDMESSDATMDIARSYGATVVQVPAAGWAEPGRQSGIDAATQPWILVLDADERAGVGIRDLAAVYMDRDDVGGVWLPRQNFQFGWWLPGSGIWPDYQLRLFRSDRTTWPAVWTHAGPKVNHGSVEHAPAELAGAIVHHSFPSIRAWVDATNRYTDHEADRLARDGRRPSLIKLLAVPMARFGELYIARRGYRGGRYGLGLALMSFCYWTLAELKLWERVQLPESGGPGAVREPPATPGDADAPRTSAPAAR